MRNIVIAIIFLFCIPLHGQLSNTLVLQKMDTLSKINLKKYVEIAQKSIIKKIDKNYKGKIKNLLKDQYKEFTESFIKDIDDERFLINHEMDSFLYKILSKLNLPDYIERPLFLVAKDYTYNAFCTPEGIIIINIAVFNHAENDDQIATIICHELAHHQLNHFLNGSASLLEDMVSKKSENQIKAIKKGKNSSENAMLLLKKKLYQNSKLKRKQELQADSLGYLFYSNSSYNRGNFINSLEYISEMDSIKFIDTISDNIYKKLFDLPGYVFSYDLLKDESKTSYKYFEQEKDFEYDSLSSHPEFFERSYNLKALFNLERDTHAIEKSPQLISIYNKVQHELLPLLYFNEEYGSALFVTLNLISNLDNDENIDDYKSWIGIIFNKLVEARSTYTFNRYVETRSPLITNKDYSKFLNFIWNLNLTSMKEIQKEYQSYIRN